MIVDMHCHILPGVDDGSASMEETVATLKEAVSQGIGGMIVTPHFHPGRFAVRAPMIKEGLEKVRSRLVEEGLKLRLYPGQECYYFSGLIHELDLGNVLTMCGTDYVLVEFDIDTQYTTIQRAVRELRDNGYKPIIAHYERYRCLYERKERLRELREKGALLQLNFARLNERGSIFRGNPWRRLLKEGYVDFLGSDTHGMNFRPLDIDRATDWLLSSVDPEISDRVLVRNIEKLIGPVRKDRRGHINT